MISVADDQRIAEQAGDPLVAHVRAVGRQRQTGRQIHQVGAAHIQHRRDQQRQLAALGLALMRQPMPEFRADAVRDRSDTIHAQVRGQPQPNPFKHTPIRGVNSVQRQTDRWSGLEARIGRRRPGCRSNSERAMELLY
jgi:hypothetical protein